MDKISERVMALSPSATFAMSQKAADLKATGLDVISLSVGEPDFNTPDHIKEAAKKAIDDNFSFYTPVPGYLSLREAICRKLKRENGLDFTPAQIVVGNGAKQELCDVILSVVNKGEEVLIPVPAWVSYMEMVKIAEGVPVLIYAGPEQKFKVTPQQLEAAITPKTKAVLICSPSNPTGSVYSKEELQGLVDVLAKYPDIIVIADEIYEHITYVGPTTSLASFPEIKDRVVVINGVSKAYAMTGWRIGYCAAPLPIAKAVSKLHGQYTSNCSSIAQKAAEAAYDGPQDCVEQMRQAFERRRDLIVGLAKQIPGFNVTVPDGAFYIFPEVSALFGKKAGDKVISSADDLAMYLLEEALVASVSGAAFGAPDCLRFSYATSDEKLIEAMGRVKAAVEKLR
ncbi:MAG: pyridoxal phosphate-dependent aminotransferase [Bacteroidales bacterium]|uniref:pyridoxal phosphate-dependent aminotransferase n=1 Tax=Candidatus Cryptobacteroides sp. TaxID=2952915 RepID=UPI002A74EABE|nr:pyridoxal phosphate-dependent aminotransferase [Candidatus Cryptobacteroides sp.]MDD7134953.1 pyridoxal phosphate-dependent aminotransferase [Bacteroidales bacterium]MDD7235203.1 pyridoxal phosphate-dependent aminotransferase [Bacteroidales bacterium]MDD7623689.1 pyridoxal phosphate-dependent aminotransferase [Bacteroidales bacterium]MDY2702406.1 pyridoxal phosphate-dependent aminotransferase [Candidatus Cryptobacteroides sp.]MDY5043543.1 pyridoxal phosphate-dependent aminotransferase [Cand